MAKFSRALQRFGGVRVVVVGEAQPRFLPLSMIHDAALEREAARVANWHAKLEAMPADAPLWRWTPLSTSIRVSECPRASTRLCR